MLGLFAVALSAGTQPEVVLSREEAETMSSPQLVARVLGNFPHHEIAEVSLPDDGPGPHGETANPSLTYIAFKEAGDAADGRFCKSRHIVATFDWLAGQEPKPVSKRSARDRKRLFNVSARPSIAVLGGRASDASCSAVPPDQYAALASEPEHERRLRQFLLLAEAYDKSLEMPSFLRCGDWTGGVNEEPCKAGEALSKIDWSRLSSVGDTEWPHRVRATRLTFTQPEGPLIHVYLSGQIEIDKAMITYAWPAPF